MARDDDTQQPKIGDGHLAAMARLGLKELRAAAYFHDSNVAQHGELGLIGSPTPAEVAEGRRSDLRGTRDEEQPSVLADHLRQAESREQQERDTQERER